MPTIARRFPRNDVYARSPLPSIVTQEFLQAAHRFEATEFRSGVFLSQPEGGHRFVPLPRLAQIAPLQGMATGDFNGDGYLDIYTLQNSYAPAPVVGRFDGGLSQYLEGDGKGGFTAAAHRISGLVVPGDAKALGMLDFDEDGWADFLVTRNSQTSLAFRNQGAPGGRPLRVTLRGPRGNNGGIGARVRLELADGSSVMNEVNAGSGWLTQAGPSLFFGYAEGNPPKLVEVKWPDGQVSRQPMREGQPVVAIEAPQQ
jgi:hypothetical protein